MDNNFKGLIIQLQHAKAYMHNSACMWMAQTPDRFDSAEQIRQRVIDRQNEVAKLHETIMQYLFN